MPRFVILRHEPSPTSQRPLHWDLMLEDQSSLLTWALDQEPVLDHPILSQRLADHRLDYLDYEGLVSRNRGTVRRWDTGQYEIRRRSEDEFVVMLVGGNLRWQAWLRRLATENHRWVVTFSRAKSSDGR